MAPRQNAASPDRGVPGGGFGPASPVTPSSPGSVEHLLQPAGGSVPPLTLQTYLVHIVLFAASIGGALLLLSRVGPLPALVFLLIMGKLGALRLPVLLLVSLVGGAGGDLALHEALRRCDTMPQPLVAKTTDSGECALLSYACSSMQGWRRSMEDAHSVVPTFGDVTSFPAAASFTIDGATPEFVTTERGVLARASFFAIFDGHSGASIAQFCGTMLPQFLASAPALQGGKVREALREAYINIDKHLSLNPVYRDDRSGCTAVSVFVSEREIVCANAGDSRAVLSRAGRAVALSVDHKPTNPAERRRIERAKGFVMNRRVNGILALSRAIGDFAFKRRPFVSWEEQAVTSVPDVVCTSIDRSTDEFIVLACDGIWDVMSSEAVVAFVRSRLLQGASAGVVCELLMDACLSSSPFGVGCDNMSVIIVELKGAHAMAAARRQTQSPSSRFGGTTSPATSSTNSSTSTAPAASNNSQMSGGTATPPTMPLPNA